MSSNSRHVSYWLAKANLCSADFLLKAVSGSLAREQSAHLQEVDDLINRVGDLARKVAEEE